MATYTSKVDKHTPKLLNLFRAKGGVKGKKIKTFLDCLDQVIVIPDISFLCKSILYSLLLHGKGKAI